ncbi:MAG: hypothetical protein ACPL07_00155 [Candidatus Bathyarchaeia archaeon]
MNEITLKNSVNRYKKIAALLAGATIITKSPNISSSSAVKLQERDRGIICFMGEVL